MFITKGIYLCRLFSPLALQGSDQSESLNQHGEEQGQVFSSFDGEFMCGVIVDHFRDGVKRRAVLAQDIAAIFALAELHVHETLAAPEKEHTTPLLF